MAYSYYYNTTSNPYYYYSTVPNNTYYSGYSPSQYYYNYYSNAYSQPHPHYPSYNTSVTYPQHPYYRQDYLRYLSNSSDNNNIENRGNREVGNNGSVMSGITNSKSVEFKNGFVVVKEETTEEQKANQPNDQRRLLLVQCQHRTRKQTTTTTTTTTTKLSISSFISQGIDDADRDDQLQTAIQSLTIN